MQDDTLCVATDKNGRPCRWRPIPGSTFCKNHDPAQAERRRKSGSIRHPRFARTLTVGGEEFDRAKSPTIPLIVNKMFEIDRELDDLVNRTAQDIADAGADPELVAAKRSILVGIAKVYSVRVSALKEARAALFDERESARKPAQQIPNQPGAMATQAADMPWMEPSSEH